MFPAATLLALAMIGGSATGLAAPEFPPSTSLFGEPGVEPAPNDPAVVVGGTTVVPGSSAQIQNGGTNPYDAEYLLACSGNAPGQTQVDCVAARNCPDPAEMLYVLWVQATESSLWLPTSQSCIAPQEARRPQVTPDLVLNEVRRIGLPALQVHVQPAGDTLVNLDTIFYAEPLPFTRTVNLLGYTVDVEASPTAYAWSFGDGTGTTTESPGAPYPAGDITHAYTDAHVTEQASVDATYTVRFRVDGGEWQTIEETITADGPSTAVTVKEAVPVLTGE
jgi:hypothetical protein